MATNHCRAQNNAIKQQKQTENKQQAASVRQQSKTARTESHNRRLKNDIAITDLDYYTFSNAVLPTKLSRKDFYTTYSTIMKKLHSHINGHGRADDSATNNK